MSGWLSLIEGAKYGSVSYNTLMKYRTMGLQGCEIDGIKRISRKVIDRLFQEYSDRYEFPAYLGIDPLTGRQKRTMKRSFITRKGADLALAHLKIDVRNGTYK